MKSGEREQQMPRSTQTDIIARDRGGRRDRATKHSLDSAHIPTMSDQTIRNALLLQKRREKYPVS